MSNDNPRQRIRRQETHIQGDNKSIAFRIDDHSVFFDNGDIASHQMVEASAQKGIVAHKSWDILTQCQTCQ